MTTIFDLPTHPLAIHLPIVLVPLAALAALVLAVRPAWRRRYGVALALVALVGAVGTVVATETGERFQDALAGRIGDLADHHAALGETTRLLSILFFGAAAAVAVVDRRAAGGEDGAGASGRAPATAAALMAVTVVLGILATVWMVRTGHEGARIVWDGVIPES